MTESLFPAKPDMPTAHDHGNCELCGFLERQARVAVTKISAIIESLATQEPRRDCIRSLEQVAASLRQEP